MNANHAVNPTRSEIQQARNAIRRSWSREQREERRQRAEARRKWLFNALIAQETVPARVA